MLIPFIKVKTIAKILLMIMMPGGKSPVNITVPQQPLMIISRLMELGPVVTKYEQGFLLQFYLSPTAYRITNEQMDMIMAGMNSEEKHTVWNEGADPSRALAAYIIQKGYVTQESPGSASHGHSASQPPSSSLSNTGQHLGLDQHYEEMRRKYAPTLSEAMQDNNISFGFKVIPESRRANVSNGVRPLHGELITMPPGTIKQYKEQGDITMLRAIRDRLRNEYVLNHKNWFLPKNWADICNQLDQAENSLIDLGHYEYPQIQKVRDMAKNGQMDQLKDRRRHVEALLADMSSRRRNDEGGRKVLLLEKRCLDMAVNNELTKPFQALAVAEGPEVKAALLEIYRRYYHGYPDLHDYFVKNAAFNIIEAAHELARRQHPNGDQVIAETQQAYVRERAAESTPINPPTTTAVTGKGTTTTSYTQSYPTTDLPATGANTSSASSYVADSATPNNCSYQAGQNTTNTPVLQYVDVQNQIIQCLVNGQDRNLLADSLGLLAHNVFTQKLDNYTAFPQMASSVRRSIDTIKTTGNAREFAFHVALVDHVLSDVQNQTNTAPTLLQRSPELLTRAISEYWKNLAPTETEISLVCDLARYVSDVTIGTHYLSPEVREQRAQTFWKTIDTLSSLSLSDLTWEKSIDASMYVAARATWAIGLVEAAAVVSSIRNACAISQTAASFASKFMGALEGIIGSTPIIGADGTAIGTISSAVAADVVKVVAVAATHELVEQPPNLFNVHDKEPQKSDKAPKAQSSQEKPGKEGKSNKPGSSKPENMTINQLFKSIRNLKKEIVKHLKKLEEYIKAPDNCDNKGFLRDAGDNIALRNQIIEKRIFVVTQEIAKFNNEIIKFVAELTKRGIACI